MAPKAVVHLMLLPFLLSLLPFSSLALTRDFCVANLLFPDTPSGYPCKPINLVTANDFYSDVLAKPGPIVPPFNTGLATADVKQCPGVNGLGLSATRVDINPGGVVPLHSHPEASELLFVVNGTLSAGFISANANRVYVKTLHSGDLFAIPQGLLHFEYNLGDSTSVAISTYSNDNPDVQVTDFALFGNTLPTDVVNKTTFIAREEIERLKRFFRIRSI